MRCHDDVRAERDLIADPDLSRSEQNGMWANIRIPPDPDTATVITPVETATMQERARRDYRPGADRQPARLRISTPASRVALVLARRTGTPSTVAKALKPLSDELPGRTAVAARSSRLLPALYTRYNGFSHCHTRKPRRTQPTRSFDSITPSRPELAPMSRNSAPRLRPLVGLCRGAGGSGSSCGTRSRSPACPAETRARSGTRL